MGRSTNILALGVALVALLALAVPTMEVAAQGGLVPQAGFDLPTNIPQDKMVSNSKSILENMEGVRNQVLALLEETRGSQDNGDIDFDKLNCLNDKLTTIKGFLVVSEQSLDKLEKADDKTDAAHQYQLIAIANDKVQNLAVEARSCAGEVLRYSGNTETKTRLRGKIAEIDPSTIVNENDTLFRLPEVTPYQ